MELTVSSTLKNLPKVTEYVNNLLGQRGFSEQFVSKIDIVIDEIFSNICYYAYEEKEGDITVSIEFGKEPEDVKITFTDNGVPYDPTKKADPSTDGFLENDSIGGLGIFMVKQTMDGLEYEYKDGKNILKTTKLV